MPLTDVRKVHMLGIAGIGMSAVARYFLANGIDVTGYDRDRSEVAIALEEEGARIHYVEDTSAIPADLDIAIYTPAIPDDSKELTALRKSSIQLMKRSEVLGLISRSNRCIAVAGTHGKTTTSSIMAYVLRTCGLDCTAFLGGISIDLNGNFALGKTDWVIVEADEYDRSFWHLEPDIAVVTSLDPDHLDVYGTYEIMVEDYGVFLRKVKRGGIVILHESVQSKMRNLLDGGLAFDLIERGISILTYGEEDVFFKIVNIGRSALGMTFDFHDAAMNATEENVELRMVGEHNVHNAGAALATVSVLNRWRGGVTVPTRCAFESLANFSGIKRRFEIVHSSSDLVVIDDYAHHPKELEAAISAARKFFSGRKITGVFQPHLFTRTRDNYIDFARALDRLDDAFVTEIYPARELPIDGITSALIVDAMDHENAKLISSEELEKELLQSDPEVLLFLGAGVLDRRIREVVKELITQPGRS